MEGPALRILILIKKIIPAAIPTMSIAMSPPMPRQKFQDSFGVIKSHLVQHVKSNGMPGDAVEWFANVSSLIYPRGRRTLTGFYRVLNLKILIRN
jgi:hypothetical protein